YQLREAVARLARGEAEESLAIETNDELEDLAADFAAMSRALARYRDELEQLVTERTRALRQTHAELADILANSADAIIGLDPERRVRVWNRGAEQLLGYPAAEVLGRELDSLLLPPGPAAERELAFIQRELTRRGAIVNHRTHRLAKDGRLIPVSLTLTLLRDETGRPVGSSAVLRDTSRQAQLEERMRRSERIAAASVMAAGLAHEINNPLAIIANRVECMEREVVRCCPGCFLDEDLSVLREHTARLSALTSDLLRLARDDDAGPAPVSMAEMTRHVAGLLEHIFATRGLQLEVEAGEAIPPLVGSEGALETVCMNLLLNAADATPAGGAVGVATRVAASGNAVELEVWDTGPGVPPELHQRIFEPFFTTKGAAKGTGLGLAVCRNVVERHHGEIRVEGRKGGGSRFIVSLPLSAEESTWHQPAYS
ncbi:MAG: PAS domain S-box protein, partial [Gemmatimonadetes bacterium]|nr:PAS domain S-box protein [Gemmatimonadota bacterium]